MKTRRTKPTSKLGKKAYLPTYLPTYLLVNFLLLLPCYFLIILYVCLLEFLGVVFLLLGPQREKKERERKTRKKERNTGP
ncbi:hypothetical protein F4802DRAFT_559515 [Xylaria palmicola]|nr:hypothetical protein F4802DRAFT_559515 [Xylaria palmicola]